MTTTLSLLSCSLLLACCGTLSATTYYVSATGADTNNGTSIATAWRTVAKVSGRNFAAGDVICFEGGESFTGTLAISSSGSAANPITYTSYGTGRATINSGNSGGLTSSKPYIVIEKLNFTGSGYTVNTASGMAFTTASSANVNQVQIDQVDVTGYGSFGIHFNFRKQGSSEYGYRGVQITNTRVHNNKDSGLVTATALANVAAYTHGDFIIRDSWFYQNKGFNTPNSSGNGISLAGMDGALIDRCIAYQNGLECTSTGGGPVGIWSWDSNNVIIQFCEAYKNGTSGLYDGGGFDIDGGNTNCIIQYCYSHENQGAGYLIAQYLNAERPMQNNILRYNLSVNDATLGTNRNQGAIHIWNDGGNAATQIQDTLIYGNTVYQAVGPDCIRTANSATTNTRIFNNIFLATNGKATARIQQTGGILMQSNHYWGSGGSFGVSWGGGSVASLAAFRVIGQEINGATPLGIHANPLFIVPGSVPTFNDPLAMQSWAAYQVSANSPAINAGVSPASWVGNTTGSNPAISHPGARDYWGSTLPQDTVYDIGAYEHRLQAPVISNGQATTATVELPFNYQILASGSPSSWVIDSGSLPSGITFNTTTGSLSGTTTAIGIYTPQFIATNSLGSSPPVAVTITVKPPPLSRLIIHEPFAYSLGANNPDVDGGLNGGNGLPATNIGGVPAGTGTGLQGNWGITTDVINGLSFTQGNKILITSGNAAIVNNNSWGGNTYSYQNMLTDPFANERISGASSGNFGLDGTSLFLSLLGKTFNNTPDAFRFSLRYDGGNNFYISNTSTGWSLNGTVATGAALALNTPTLFVVRFDFGIGATDTISLWVNPPLGQPLGEPNASVGNIDFPGIGNYQTRAAVSNAMVFDELRLGTTLAAVTPFTEPTILESFRTAYSLAADGSQDLQTPADDGICNLLKFAFNMIGTDTGQAPTLDSPNTSILTAGGSAGLPALEVTDQVQLSYIRRKSSSNPGVTYTVQFSSDLSPDSWDINPAAIESITSLDSNFERVTVADSSNSDKRFARVLVTAP